MKSVVRSAQRRARSRKEGKPAITFAVAAFGTDVLQFEAPTATKTRCVDHQVQRANLDTLEIALKPLWRLRFGCKAQGTHVQAFTFTALANFSIQKTRTHPDLPGALFENFHL